tara:strand:+ start:653 stop:1024 length:372 start_codon:yes stop_codon:yes gene_type:complete
VAHYAKIVETKVVKVIVADAAYINEFVDDSPGTWIKVSINTRGGIHYAPYSHTPDDGTPLRKNFAGVGHIYDATRDAFYEPQPYTSWTLNEDSCQWEAPVAYPNDGNVYEWNESDQQWDEVSI